MPVLKKTLVLAKKTVSLARNVTVEMDPVLKLYLLHLGRGVFIGFLIHKTAKLILFIINRRRLRGLNVDKNNSRAERIMDVVNVALALSLRGGDLITGSVLGPIVLRVLEAAATDMSGAIFIAALSSSSSFLINNPDVIRKATVGYLYTQALAKIPSSTQGSLVGNVLNIACEKTEDYLRSILFSKAPDREKRQAIRRYFSRVIRKGLQGDNKLAFVMCLVGLLTALYFAHSAAYYILLEMLAEAYEDGQISESAYRSILRKLLREHVPVDPDLLRKSGQELVNRWGPPKVPGLEEELISLDLSLFFNKTIEKV
jgi:hypothetical protein